MLGERLRNNTGNNDDVFNIFGKHVAAKLRTLPKQTKLYTEKLINDLLFEAEMGNVDKNTKIVTLANKPTNVFSTDVHVNNDIMVYDYPNLQSNQNQYSSPATDHKIHQHQATSNASVSTFFWNI